MEQRPTNDRTSAPRFRLEAELGAGATGRVHRGVLVEGYEAWPAGLPVAVKYLHPHLENDPRARARFEAEGRAGSAVRHPGVVHVLGSGLDARGRFLVLPFVPGETLRALLEREGAAPEPLVRRVGLSLAGGLAALHAAGFVHGDVKPENVRLDAEGNAVLLDLGFARPIAAKPDASIAPRAGSLPYVAPEVAQGGAGGPESDVFALGVVIYELATGVHPFAAEASRGARPRPHGSLERSGSSGQIARTALSAPDADRLIAAIVTARFVPPSRSVPQISPFLDRNLEEALRRDPARRPDAAEFAARLREEESGTWWRGEVEFAAGARRSTAGETDATSLTPLVGRARELELLLSAWERSAESPQSAWIRGPAGAGKTRLVLEFTTRVRTSGDPPLVLFGRSRALEQDRPCKPILRMLERYLRLAPGAKPGARDRAELSGLVPPGHVDTLLRALDADNTEESGAALPLALGEWIAALARRGRLVVHVDDVQWSGVGTLESIARAAENLRGGRALFLLGQRDDSPVRSAAALESLRARLASLGGEPVDLKLAPLGVAEVQELVERTFHHTAPRLKLSEVLLQRSRGNPGILAEILRGLLEKGSAVDHMDGTGLVLSIEPDELPLPSSVRAAIVESYKRLSTNERSWLRRLAVVGGRIEVDFLLRAFPDARRVELDALLARLVRAGWLAPSGSRYRFARPALREAVYRALSREQRLRLHAAAAEALVPAEGVPSTLEEDFQRTFHLHAAEDDERLLSVLPPLLLRLLKNGQTQRVHPLAQWGLEAVDRRAPSEDRERLRIELLEAAADAADRLGMREDQRAALDRLSDSAFDAETDPLSAGRVYLLHARFATSTGQYGLARGLLRNAVELFERAKAERELSESQRRLALVQAHVGELDEARELAKRSREHAATPPQEALAHLAQGVVDVLEDRVEPAMEHANRAIDILRADREHARPGIFGTAYLLRARIYRSSGEPGRALASAARAVRLAREAGERRLEAEALARLGQLHLDVDRVVEAEAQLREALRVAEEIEDRRGQALARTFLGILLWENDDPAAAAMLERAAALSDEMGLNRITALVSGVRARIALLQARDHSAALLWSASAEDLVRRFGAELADRIVILGTRALVLETAGLVDEARSIERALYERLERENARVRSPLLRLRQSRAGQRLLEAVLTAEGPLYPRVRIDEGPAASPGS
ncbi:MAG: protein kinase [Planctomycetota bacterium]|nr:protein kinase [Planctomycetota bacterium]